MKIKKSDRIEGLLSDEQGLTTVEYIIILCLIMRLCKPGVFRFSECTNQTSIG